MPNEARTWGVLKKAVENSDGSLTIVGIVSSGETDCENESVDWESSWPYLERRMQRMRQSSHGKSLLPVRVQHDVSRPAGHVTAIWRDNGEIWVKALIEDADAVKLIKSGTLSQLSLGGTYVSKEYLDSGVYTVTVDPVEISVVDAGCNYDARIVDMKAAAQGFELRKCDGRVEVVRCAGATKEQNSTRVGADTSRTRTQKETNESMTREDHAECEKRNFQMAEHHKALHELHKAAAEHHGRMGKNGGGGGLRFTAAERGGDFYKHSGGLSSEEEELAGGLRRNA